MQWLIDIITAKVIAEIGIPPVFIDRGDPAAYDFTLTDFTTDDTWRDIDLSSIVPAGAQAVALYCYVSANVALATVLLRKKTNSNIHNRSTVRTQIANVSVDPDIIVPCDANRKIQYKAKNVDWTDMTIAVKGWWL